MRTKGVLKMGKSAPLIFSKQFIFQKTDFVRSFCEKHEPEHFKPDNLARKMRSAFREEMREKKKVEQVEEKLNEILSLAVINHDKSTVASVLHEMVGKHRVLPSGTIIFKSLSLYDKNQEVSLTELFTRMMEVCKQKKSGERQIQMISKAFIFEFCKRKLAGQGRIVIKYLEKNLVPLDDELLSLNAELEFRKTGNIDSVSYILESIKDSHPPETSRKICAHLFTYFGRENNIEACHILLERMPPLKIDIQYSMVSNVLHAYCRRNFVKRTISLYELLLDLKGNKDLSGFMIGFLEKLREDRNVESAFHIFKSWMRFSGSESYFQKGCTLASEPAFFSVLFRIYSEAKDAEGVSMLVRAMKRQNVKMNTFLLNTMLFCYGRLLGDFESFDSLLGLYDLRGIKMNEHTYHTVASCYKLYGYTEKSNAYFKLYQRAKNTNSHEEDKVMDLLAEDKISEAEQIVTEMLIHKKKAVLKVANLFLRVLCQKFRFTKAFEYFEFMTVSLNFPMDSNCLETLLTYCPFYFLLTLEKYVQEYSPSILSILVKRAGEEKQLPLVLNYSDFVRLKKVPLNAKLMKACVTSLIICGELDMAKKFYDVSSLHQFTFPSQESEDLLWMDIFFKNEERMNARLSLKSKASVMKYLRENFAFILEILSKSRNKELLEKFYSEYKQKKLFPSLREAIFIVEMYGALKDKEGLLSYLKKEEGRLTLLSIFHARVVEAFCNMDEIEMAHKRFEILAKCQDEISTKNSINHSHNVAYRAFIDYFCRKGDIQNASMWLEQAVQDNSADINTFNIFLSSLSNEGDYKKVEAVFSLMAKLNIFPDETSFSAFFSVIQPNELERVSKAFDLLFQVGFTGAMETSNPLFKPFQRLVSDENCLQHIRDIISQQSNQLNAKRMSHFVGFCLVQNS